MRLKVLILCIISMLSAGLFAAPPQYRLPKTENLTERGIKVKVPKNARQIPPSPTVTRELSRNEEKFPAQIIHDAWRQRQWIAAWNDAELGDVLLHEIAYPVPNDLKPMYQGYTTVEKIDAWFAKTHPPLDQAAALKAAELIIGTTISNNTMQITKGSGSAPFVERLTITGAVSSDNTAGGIPTVYLITTKSGGETHYFLLNYTRPAVNAKYDTAALKEADKAAAGFTWQRPTRKTVGKTATNKNDAKRSTAYLRKRDEIAKQIANMKGWSFEELDHYIVMTNAKNRRMVKMIENELDLCRDVYTRFFPQGNVDSDVGRVKVFAERSEYLAYIPPEHANSAGLFMSGTGELVIAPRGDRSAKAAAESTMSVIYHEGFHHFLFQCGGGLAHMWFNEGCARLFENIDFRGNRASVKLEGGNLQRWKSAVPDDPAALRKRLEGILKLSQKEFYEPSSAMSNYDFSGFLMYFLLKSPAFLPDKKYEQIAYRYFDAVTKGAKDPNAVAWKEIDLDAFCKDLLRFKEQKRWQTQAAGYLPPASDEK